jgi:mRNA-degrading endonuclease RelE of RelBE toxin-antitoxin system
MRTVAYSKTFTDQLHVLLRQGYWKFGARVVSEKRTIVYDTIDDHLAHFPGTGIPDKRLDLMSYAISRTPFVVLYDFDDDDLRLHFVVHKRADRRKIDPADIQW